MVSWGNLADRLEQWATSKYALSKQPYFIDNYIERDNATSNPETPFEKLDIFFQGKLEDDPYEFVKASEYWDTTIRKPEGKIGTRIEGKVPVENPITSWYGKMPDMTQYYVSGAATPDFSPTKMEQAHAQGHHGVTFSCRATSGTAQQVRVGVWGRGIADIFLEITDAIPSDYQTTAYTYQHRITRDTIEFYVHGELRAVVVLTEASGISDRIVKENVKPYSIGICQPLIHPVASPAVGFAGPESESMKVDFDARNYWVAEGCQPATGFGLYEENTDTRLAGSTYDAKVTSHPVPTANREATVLFRADTDSATDGLTLEVYTYAGSWRAVKEITYTANDLVKWILDVRSPLVRLSYDPAAVGATITDAEVNVGR